MVYNTYEIEISFSDIACEFPLKGVLDNPTDAYKWAVRIRDWPTCDTTYCKLNIKNIKKNGKKISFSELENEAVINL